MDMEEIILHHMYIKKWVDKFVQEDLKKKNSQKEDVIQQMDVTRKTE